LLLVAGFVLPGAISMFVYGLKVPQRDYRLQERVLEAVCFSLLNFVLVWLPIHYLISFVGVGTSVLATWLMALIGFVLLPLGWPFCLVWLLRLAEARHWVSASAKTAWDEFFSRQKNGAWLQFELNDGRVVGGKFGSRSYASSYPDPGHMFLEELWKVDDQGRFTERWPGGAGLLLRPTDHRLVRVYEEA